MDLVVGDDFVVEVVEIGDGGDYGVGGGGGGRREEEGLGGGTGVGQVVGVGGGGGPAEEGASWVLCLIHKGNEIYSSKGKITNIRVCIRSTS